MNEMDTVLDDLEGLDMPAKKTAAKKKADPKPPRIRAVPPTLDPSMMNEILLEVHELAKEINASRARTDELIAQSDDKVREAVDEGERYRDIAAAAGRTVPWVQMSLRRVAGVPTHPAAPIPDSVRRRKAS